MNTAVLEFLQIIKDNKAGRGRGIYSVCSAHEAIIRAAMKQAMVDSSILLVESTSNQVDQYGGYTGMRAKDFVSFVKKIASETGFPESKILFGGDHLGPNGWQDKNAAEAMTMARELVSQYVKAGYHKIHLDCSMPLADDGKKALDNETVASRAASLCSVAENAWKTLGPGNPAPVYVIGTEVPIPGGAKEHEEGLNVTLPEDAKETVNISREIFLNAGLEEAWDRVCALVVQPGVEFGDDQVFEYERKKAKNLIRVLDELPNLVFEAHSTDYQSESGLTALVEDHFCIQKVGPWLTYAWREALFALADIESEIVGLSQSSRLKCVLEEVMQATPKYWKKYYQGTDEEQRIKRKYSYSDRSRYYWSSKTLNASVNTLFSNLEKNHIPATLFCQYLPGEYHAWREGKINLSPREIAEYHVRLVLQMYSRACKMGK